MKAFIVVCLFALAAVAFARPNERYTDKYDNIDLDELISNDRVFHSYIECVLGRGKCTPEGKELKSHIIEALETECAKCTEAQKNGTKKIIRHLVNNKKESWDELTAKYDPQRKYAEKYEKELREVKA